MTKPEYISLKKAAQISGYSADYIGYLIRTGKISGRPVYTNITWQTTVEEVLNYKNRKEKKKKKLNFKEKILESLYSIQRKLAQEIKIMKLFIKTFQFILPLIIILILTFSTLIGFVFSTKFEKSNREQTIREKTLEENESIEDKNADQTLIY